jgi:uncharacterized membrane protein
MENNNDYLKNKAYKEALKLEKSEFEEEVIYAKLEKQGIPIDIAKEVAMNVIIERNNKKENSSDYKKMGFVMLVVWILVSIIAFLITGKVLDSLGLLVIGVPTTIIVYLMTTDRFNVVN